MGGKDEDGYAGCSTGGLIFFAWPPLVDVAVTFIACTA